MWERLPGRYKKLKSPNGWPGNERGYMWAVRAGPGCACLMRKMAVRSEIKLDMSTGL
jgi:hypothetical protein